jgi:hypothetical protein
VAKTVAAGLPESGMMIENARQADEEPPGVRLKTLDPGTDERRNRGETQGGRALAAAPVG